MSSHSISTSNAEAQRLRFEWQKKGQGLWERDLDECELFYVHSARRGKSHFPLTGYASFKTHLQYTTKASVDTLNIDGALRKAWLILSYNHPTLTSYVEHEKTTGRLRRIYQAFRDECDEERWLASTFKVVSTPLEPVEWYNDGMPSADKPTVTLVESTREDASHKAIFIQCPHDITDGVGILQLLDQLFNLTAQSLKQGPEHVMADPGDVEARLSPCLRIAADIPGSNDDVIRKLFKDIQAQNRALYAHGGLLGIPASSKTIGSGHETMRRTCITLPKPVSTAILRGCKSAASGVSLTHVFTSALALALRDLQPRRDEPYPVRYVSHGMMNLRPYCSRTYKGADHAAAAYHTVSAQAMCLDLEVPTCSSGRVSPDESLQLLELTTSVRDFYKAVRPAVDTGVYEQVMLAPLMFQSITPHAGSDPHSVSEPSFCSVALSSIGNIGSIVASKHESIELTDVWAASEPIGAGVALFLGTWDSKIGFSGVYDTQYHDASYIEQFLLNITDKICSGLNDKAVEQAL